MTYIMKLNNILTNEANNQNSSFHLRKNSENDKQLNNLIILSTLFIVFILFIFYQIKTCCICKLLCCYKKRIYKHSYIGYGSFSNNL